ncbi:hypothetical protein ES705_47882 [subsurface metagenome]
MKTKISLTLLIFLMAFNASVNTQDITKDTLQLEEIVVTGTKTEVVRKNVPLSVSIINKKEIKESSESALLPIISEKRPGVFITERGVPGFGVTGAAAGQISIRGVGCSPNTQVLILLYGHPQYTGIIIGNAIDIKIFMA